MEMCHQFHNVVSDFQVLKMDNKYYWLIMSAEKDDAQIIDTDSEMWGYLSQCDKSKKTEGKKARFFKCIDWRTYKILKHGTDDYTADFVNWENSLNLTTQFL